MSTHYAMAYMPDVHEAVANEQMDPDELVGNIDLGYSPREGDLFVTCFKTELIVVGVAVTMPTKGGAPPDWGLVAKPLIVLELLTTHRARRDQGLELRTPDAVAFVAQGQP